MESNTFLCFICGTYFSSNEIQNHIYKCKLTHKSKTKQRITLPEEYSLLFKIFKGGLSLSQEEIENFNNKLAASSLKPSTQKSNTFSNTSMSSTMPQRRKGERPVGVICPLCGRNYGSASIGIVYILIYNNST